MSFEEEFERANRRGKEMRARMPWAVSARYDRARGRVVIGLSSGLEVGFPPAYVEGLENAGRAELEKIEISPSGLGLHFPMLDADVYLPALLDGIYGTRRWMAARLGSVGGLSRTKRKIAAARENGKLGGRPRKRAEAGVK